MAPEIASDENAPAKPDFWARADRWWEWGKRALTVLFFLGGLVWFTGVFSTKAEINNAAIEARFLKVEAAQEADKKADEKTYGAIDEKIDKLSDKMVTKDSFQTFQNMYREDRDRQNNLLERLLEKP